MISLTLQYPYGATPLDPNEIEGLIPKHISTMGQLNEWEQHNILAADSHYAMRKLSYTEILEASFIKIVYLKMFNETWKWAGEFRLTEKSIGVDPFTIAVRLKQLLDDILYHIENKTYHIDEIATRFHHRLVSIHPFPNGNGRHARFVADLLLTSEGQRSFTWGLGLQSAMTNQEIRKKYIDALRAADKHDYHSLLRFVRQ